VAFIAGWKGTDERDYCLLVSFMIRRRRQFPSCLAPQRHGSSLALLNDSELRKKRKKRNKAPPFFAYFAYFAG
jgi:hypothetical protein